MKIYLEVTRRRTFAVAVDWPGWARSGKTEDEALDALLAYGERYRRSLGAAAASLKVPATTMGLNVVERLEGNATTEFGAPGVVPDVDTAALSDVQLDELIKLLRAAWTAFDRAAASASGHDLAPAGPRGGGRELAKIREHVAGAEAGYTGAVGGKARESDPWDVIQDAFIDAVRGRAHGELPDVGPRGGKRWPARYAIRRSAWHALDHAWEIEDRAT
jgi:hypothetical protein